MSKINEKPYTELYYENYVNPTKEKKKEMYYFIADVLDHYSFHYLKRKVKSNPNRITFNPAEAELQKLYHDWHNTWKRKQKLEQEKKNSLYFLLFFCGIALILLFLLLFNELGIITLPEQLL
mgnify:FL=1|tara:strand:+ start:97 stop:462 length:366 start_codon:yes stop_codon:yes gene_type:complete